MSKRQSHINPHFKKRQSIQYSVKECIEGVKAGERKILSYCISKAESPLSEDQQLVKEILYSLPAHSGIRKLAISGSPGVGKSTFINAFGSFLGQEENRLAILPVDPSSQISKGSILGDKTRMHDIVGKDNIYIKPIASALSLGGVAPSSQIASMICERAPFDYIITETVGVGQSEYEARDIADMFILLLQPGGGDDLQGIKRGIMEMADIMIITKADGELLKSAQEALKAYRNAMSLFPTNDFDWKVKVRSFSAMTHDGAEEIQSIIEDYFQHMITDDRLHSLRKSQELKQFNKKYSETIISYLEGKEGYQTFINTLKTELNSGKIINLQALDRLFEFLKNEAF